MTSTSTRGENLTISSRAQSGILMEQEQALDSETWTGHSPTRLPREQRYRPSRNSSVASQAFTPPSTYSRSMKMNEHALCAECTGLSGLIESCTAWVLHHLCPRQNASMV